MNCGQDMPVVARAAARAATAPKVKPRARAAGNGRRIGALPARMQRLLREAQRALDARRPARAQTLLLRAQPACADHPEFLRLLGLVRHRQKRYADALHAFRRALALAPAEPLLLTHLGATLRASGELAAAESVLRLASRLAPDLADAWHHLGRLLSADARAAEAADAHARAVRCDPRHLDARLAHADCLRTQGLIAEAAAGYRALLKRAPRQVRAWSRLANLKTVRFDAGETAALETLRDDPALSADERIAAGFACAKAFEDAERYADACAAIVDANAARRRTLHWDAHAFSRRVDAIAAAFAAMPASAAPADLGREVVFIVSMPRSGSTLTEQILSSHAQVEGAGELPTLVDVLREESRRRGAAFPAWVARARRDDWHRLGETYLERTARWRGARARFTDKALANWLYVGAIRAMLPGARFVNVRRDALETCLSCFRQGFLRGHHYTYDIGELARFRRDYERLTRLWRERHPQHVHDFVYEDLLADPERAIRGLLAFCGLPFDAACLRFHENRRGVRTLSSAQVREPLRRDTARAHRYAALNAPMRAALLAVGIDAASLRA